MRKCFFVLLRHRVNLRQQYISAHGVGIEFDGLQQLRLGLWHVVFGRIHFGQQEMKPGRIGPLGKLLLDALKRRVDLLLLYVHFEEFVQCRQKLRRDRQRFFKIGTGFSVLFLLTQDLPGPIRNFGIGRCGLHQLAIERQGLFGAALVAIGIRQQGLRGLVVRVFLQERRERGDGRRGIAPAGLQIGQEQDGIGIAGIPGHALLKTVNGRIDVLVPEMREGQLRVNPADRRIQTLQPFEPGDGWFDSSLGQIETARQHQRIVVHRVPGEHFLHERVALGVIGLGKGHFRQPVQRRQVIRGRLDHLLQEPFACGHVAGTEFEFRVVQSRYRPSWRLLDGGFKLAVG